VNPEQQRIAIAEACGFAKDWDFKRAQPCRGWCVTSLPDYLNDLNAMHEAENVLTNEQWWLFVEFLTEIRGGGVALCISATAAQRAEAFLKTLNLWKP
jgi:hypothetical protein